MRTTRTFLIKFQLLLALFPIFLDWHLKGSRILETRKEEWGVRLRDTSKSTLNFTTCSSVNLQLNSSLTHEFIIGSW